jgi:hypothetical protein
MHWQDPIAIRQMCAQIEARSRKGEYRDLIKFFLRAARHYSEHLMLEGMRVPMRIDVTSGRFR